MKNCKECGHPFSYDDFHKKSSTPDGYSYYCKGCTSDRAKNYYRHSDGVKEKILERNKEKLQASKKFVLEYLLSHPCACGEARPECLDFDHQRDKIMNVSSMLKRNWSLETIKTEIEKCQVLCANCHRVKTAKDFGWYAWYPR